MAESIQLFEMALRTVRRALIALEDSIETISSDLADAKARGKYDAKLGSHLSYMSEGAVKVADAIRKLADHERKSVDAMTPEEKEELLIEYVESQPRDARARIIARLAAIDAEEGVLGAKAQVKAAKPKIKRKASK